MWPLTSDLTRWVFFTSILSLIGVYGFEILILPPGRAERSALMGSFKPWSLFCLIVLSAALAMDAFAHACCLTGGFMPGCEALQPLLCGTHYGRVWWIRLGLIGVLWVVAFLRADAWRMLRFLAAMTLGWTIALTSHAADQGDWTWRVFNDAVHVNAAGLWIGGLVCLGMTLRSGPFSGSPDYLYQTSRRFSLAAGICLLAVTVSGTVNAWLSMSTLADFWQTMYGRTLLIKLGLVAMIVGIGAYNRFVLMPRRALAPLGRSAWREAVIALGVLAATAFLCDTIPARHAHHGNTMVDHPMH